MNIKEIMFVYSYSWIIFPFEGIFRHNFEINHCEHVYIGRRVRTSGFIWV